MTQIGCNITIPGCFTIVILQSQAPTHYRRSSRQPPLSFGCHSIKTQALAEADTAVTAVSNALTARKAAEQTLANARAAEDGARETFVSAYDANAGAIRRLFPRNRVRQDLHFDQFRTATAADNPGAPGGNGDAPTHAAGNAGEAAGKPAT
jgi:hypothetical protein